ncbi:type IV pilus biogenesis/stability protein PilW [Ideonella sp.]|uniref:type IV pilus biogenesis/stability protein PilW n=1 Tax=Ideonella sp. TaxID=1929293 RepID=UPI0037C0E547
MTTSRFAASAIPVSLAHSVWRKSLLVLGLAALLAGCVGGPTREQRESRATANQNEVERRARVRLELAAAYFGRGQNTTALDEVKQALATDPNLGEAFNLRGLIYASMDEAALAEQSFKQSLQINPRDADAMHNFGWFLCQQRRFVESDTQFQAAVAQPTYREALRTMMAQGICQARSGRLDLAERTLGQAYELDPSNPAVAVNLSEVLYKRGDYERARFYIRRVNAQEGLANAQTLWLALRIENRLGQTAQVQALGDQIRQRWADSPEAKLLAKGRIDE